MKFGCCVKNAEEARVAQEAGYDFVECTVVSLKPEEEEAAFREILESYQKLSIGIEVCNVFLPGDLKIVGDAVDWERVERYVSSALRRVKETGADTVVFGSGKARTIPEGFPREKAEKQIVHFLDIAAKYAQEQGITIVIEPLNLKESNIIINVAEGVQFAQKINRPSVQVLADFYHMDEEREPLTEIVSNKDFLRHIHVADTGRRQPGMGHYPYPDFVQCIREAGYDGRICIEANWTNFNLEELTKALQFLKEQFEVNE